MMSNSLPSVLQLPRLITDFLTVQEVKPSLTTNDFSPSKKFPRELLPAPVIPSKTILEISKMEVLLFPNYKTAMRNKAKLTWLSEFCLNCV